MRKQTLFIAIATVAFLFAAGSFAFAQNQTFKPGDRVLASPTFMDDEKYWWKCVYVRFDDSTNSPHVVECDGGEYRTQSKYIRPLGKAETQNNPTGNDNGSTTVRQTKPPDETAGSGECDFEPPAPEYSNKDRFSAKLAKRNIYDGYARLANGTGVAPLRVGVTFLSFQVGKSFTNAVRNVPGVGAKRINDAAPPNAMIYRVKSKHIVCEEYRDRTLRRQVESEYDCFKNRDGEWVCGSGGDTPPKIKQL